LRAKKAEIDRQNDAIANIKDTQRMALLARYNEINDSNRIETLKLPNIYKQKPAEERNDDSFGLLKNF
jgi:hypothetical protein